MFLIENLEAAMLDSICSIQVHRRRPRLPGVAHGPARQAMEPFIELPFLSFTKTYHSSQSVQLATSFLQPACLHQGSHVDPADKGPGSPIVIVVRLVEITDAIIFAPVFLAWLDGRIKSTHGKGII